MTKFIDVFVMDPDIRGPYPPLSPHKLAGLRQDLIQFGLRRDSITICRNNSKLYVVHGFNLVEQCRRLDIPVTEDNIVLMDFADLDGAKFWRSRKIMSRIHLSTIEKCIAAFALKPVYDEIGKKRMAFGGQGGCAESEPWDTWAELALNFEASTKTMSNFKALLEHASVEVKRQLMLGEVTVTGAYRLLKQAEKLNEAGSREVPECLMNLPINLPDLKIDFDAERAFKEMETVMQELKSDFDAERAVEEVETVGHGSQFENHVPTLEPEIDDEVSADNSLPNHSTDKLEKDTASRSQFQIISSVEELKKYPLSKNENGRIVPIITNMERRSMCYAIFFVPIQTECDFEIHESDDLDAFAKSLILEDNNNE